MDIRDIKDTPKTPSVKGEFSSTTKRLMVQFAENLGHLHPTTLVATMMVVTIERQSAQLIKNTHNYQSELNPLLGSTQTILDQLNTNPKNTSAIQNYQLLKPTVDGIRKQALDVMGRRDSLGETAKGFVDSKDAILAQACELQKQGKNQEALTIIRELYEKGSTLKAQIDALNKSEKQAIETLRDVNRSVVQAAKASGFAVSQSATLGSPAPE